MTKKLFLFFPLLWIACSNANFPGSDPVASRMGKGKEIVEINGVAIGEGYLEMLSDINPRVKSQLRNPMARNQIVKNLVEQELMYQESIERGLDKEKDVAEKAALYRRVVIAQALLDDELEKKSKEYYEKNKDAEFTKVQVSGIQIDFKAEVESKNAKPVKPTEATPAEKQAALRRAEAVYARLKKGEDFARVAEEVSDDKITRKKGGDLGLIARTEKKLERRGLLKIADTTFQLKKDEISRPFETKNSYYIVKATSDLLPTPFEEADNMIRFQIRQDVKNEMLGLLTKKGKIKYAESAPAEEPPPPSAETPEPAPPPENPPPEGTTTPPAQPNSGTPPSTAPSGGEPTQPDSEKKPGVIFKPGTLKSGEDSKQ